MSTVKTDLSQETADIQFPILPTLELTNRDREFVSAPELSEILGVSTKTITNNTHRIVGRVKIGSCVRYHLPTLRKSLLAGKNILQPDSENNASQASPKRKRSILPKTGSMGYRSLRKDGSK